MKLWFGADGEPTAEVVLAPLGTASFSGVVRLCLNEIPKPPEAYARA